MAGFGNDRGAVQRENNPSRWHISQTTTSALVVGKAVAMERMPAATMPGLLSALAPKLM
jgi:hypothetical protein